MRNAFSVVEVVVVAVILLLVATLSIPRASEASNGDAEAQTRARLAILRNAIELYYYDHGVYPGARGDGNGGNAGTPAAFVAQLTLFTDAEGRVAAAQSELHRYGPYLRDGIPPCPMSPVEGKSGLYIIGGDEAPGFVATAPEAGWIYNFETGAIAANSDMIDGNGVRVDRY